MMIVNSKVEMICYVRKKGKFSDKDIREILDKNITQRKSGGMDYYWKRQQDDIIFLFLLGWKQIYLGNRKCWRKINNYLH